MPLQLSDGWSSAEKAGDWPLSGLPPFADSPAHQLLLRDLRRYVFEEVPGRSFLIAGHRGAGKTAVVTHAAHLLRNEILVGATSPEIPLGRKGRLQRPLLVKLVGQSLLAPPPQLKPKDPKDGETPVPGPSTEAGAAGTAAVGGDGAAPDHAAAAGNALVHITIALYRALADEAAWAFRRHALAADDTDRADRVELAAQLALDLDGTPDPATLRGYWQQMGRVEEGVFWPSATKEPLRASGIHDQGMREIVALATAAQAFQVCSGAIAYSEKVEDVDKTISKTESGFDTREAVSRLGGIGAGALAGSIVGVGAGPVTGLGAGLLAWLLASASLKWTGSKERNRTATIDYKFIRDRSIQTLDRDLPLVIDRIREAGLAPIFIVDELDKIKDVKQNIARIIGRLKHLVSDYGFFCFLTGRDYFDEIERTIASEAYPSEHTYFSERVLLFNRAQDTFAYLNGRIVENDADTAHRLKAAVFALLIMYRSKMNFTDIAREVARLTGPADVLNCSDDDLQSGGRFRLAATIQIAINTVLGTPDFAQRLDADPGFAQLALDALYYIPRRLEANSDALLDVSEAAITAELCKRMGRRETALHPDAGPGDDGATEDEKEKEEEREDEGTPDRTLPISQPELRELAAMVKRLAGHLADLGGLKQLLEKEAETPAAGGRSADAALLAEIVFANRGSLIAPTERPDHYRFLLDELARPIVLGDPGTPGGAPPTAAAPAAPAREAPPTTKPVTPTPIAPEALARGNALVESLRALLSESVLTVDDLVTSGLLDRTVGGRYLRTTLIRLEAAQRRPDDAEAVSAALSRCDIFAAQFDARGDDVAQALVLLARARPSARDTPDAPAVLARIARYFAPVGPAIVPSELRLHEPWVAMAGDAESIDSFRHAYAEWTPGDAEASSMDPASLWEHWRERVADLLVPEASPTTTTARFADVVCAAADEPPGALFRLHLGRMDRNDWSRAALAALPRNKVIDGPAWLLFASLHALGFGRGLLQRLAEARFGERVPSGETGARLIGDILSHAVEAPPGVLSVYRDDERRDADVPIEPGQPVLAIGRSVWNDYVEGLDWLAGHDAFQGGEYEDG
jgi:hypothetical protein